MYHSLSVTVSLFVHLIFIRGFLSLCLSLFRASISYSLPPSVCPSNHTPVRLSAFVFETHTNNMAENYCKTQRILHRQNRRQRPPFLQLLNSDPIFIHDILLVFQIVIIGEFVRLYLCSVCLYVLCSFFFIVLCSLTLFRILVFLQNVRDAKFERKQQSGEKAERTHYPKPRRARNELDQHAS